MIQDELDGTQEAVIQEPTPEIGPVLHAHARHGRHALRHTFGNCLQCFSACSPTRDDDCAVTSAGDNGGDHVTKLTFNRVDMSNKIKLLIDGIDSLCSPVSDLLSKIPNSSTSVPLIPTRPQRGSTIVQGTSFVGRGAIFKKTIDDITDCGETHSVLPIVGPGGIGKTTFTQHLYNDTRTRQYFDVKVWVSVSIDFDVLKLTQQILRGILATGKEGSNTATETLTTNLDQLQISIAKKLKSKRLLVVLDDIWKCDSEDEWRTLLAPFMNGGGSMVLVTTRSPKLAEMMKTVNPIELQGLESKDFFTFFEACIFGEHKKPEHYEDDLTGIARQIADKLKGSPLAAKTTARLLKKRLSHEHWNEVLLEHEWLNQQNNDDILPSLKISYDYLPFKLKKCFSFCALFPKDHRFNDLQFNHFLLAIGIIDSSRHCDRNYLEELVDDGFLLKEVDYSGQYYVMHHLMHELSQVVSAQECLNISCSNFQADALPKSIRHISITIENKYDEQFKQEMIKLKGRIGIANLRTLMVFREYEEKITEILDHTFKEIKGLRVLFIVLESLESLPHNFSKLIHLQYLKISSPYNDTRNNTEMSLPRTLSRFYHLKLLDLEDWHGSSSLPKDFSCLVNLRYFIAEKELHSNVPEVGKMKYLQELKEFHVKKERDGFELRELGELTELGGTLSICNLENVGTNGEASEAKLMSKGNLKKLRLVWGRGGPTTDVDALDGLKPHSNLRALEITNHVGMSGPSWLCLDIGVKRLETLHLEGVSWALPPIGQLPYLKELSLKSMSRLHRFGPDYGGFARKCFMHLKTVVFHDLPELVEWVVEPNCHSFPSLESIQCSACPKLHVMPLLECNFTKLCSLRIYDCPVLSLPPMPHNPTLRYFVVRKNRSEILTYHGKSLDVRNYDGELAFHNLDGVEDLSIAHISLTDLEKLKSLRKLTVRRCDSMFSEEQDGSDVLHSVQCLTVNGSHITGKLLSKLFNCFPALSELEIHSSLQNEDHEERVIQFPLSSSLQMLTFDNCEDLVLVPAEDGEGIQEENMMPLLSLTVSKCAKLFSRWPMGEAGGAQTINPFFASIQSLTISNCAMPSMTQLSNLTSLTCLRLYDCDGLKVDGFISLITLNLKELVAYGIMGSDSPDSVPEGMPAAGSQLERLEVDRTSMVHFAPTGNLLHTLSFCCDGTFTKEQEKALQLLTSLQKLEFINCKDLRSLPQGLHRLPSLKELEVFCCDELEQLPREGLPTSLLKLSIGPNRLSAKLKEDIEKVKASNPDLLLECWY